MLHKIEFTFKTNRLVIEEQLRCIPVPTVPALAVLRKTTVSHDHAWLRSHERKSNLIEFSSLYSPFEQNWRIIVVVKAIITARRH